MAKEIDPKRVESAVKLAVSQRNYRRARDRALVRLANDYREEYLAYLKEEQERDYREGRNWVDIAGNTRARNYSRPPQRARKSKLSRRRGGK